MAKMRQNRYQGLFVVISFHAGVQFNEYQLQMKSFSKSH